MLSNHMPQINIVQTSNVDLVVDSWRLFAVQLVKIWGPLLLRAIFTCEVRQESFWFSFLLPPTDYSFSLSILTRKRTQQIGPRSDWVLFPPLLSFIWGKTQAHELGTQSSISSLPSFICPHGCTTFWGYTPLCESVMSLHTWENTVIFSFWLACPPLPPTPSFYVWQNYRLPIWLRLNTAYSGKLSWILHSSDPMILICVL